MTSAPFVDGEVPSTSRRPVDDGVLTAPVVGQRSASHRLSTAYNQAASGSEVALPAHSLPLVVGESVAREGGGASGERSVPAPGSPTPRLPRGYSEKFCVPCNRRGAAHINGRCVMEHTHG